MAVVEKGADEAGESELAFHVTLYVDVLGQRQLLRELRSLPADDAERATTITTLQRTAGAVRMVRESFERFLDALRDPGHGFEDVPAEKQELALRLRQMKVRSLGFSDTFVVSAEMKGDEGPSRPLNGIYAVLFSAAGMMAASLAVGVPLRGGVEIGLGIDLGDQEIYGAGLVLAHDLESVYAEYPRILVGYELFHYLTRVAAGSASSIAEKYAKSIAQDCLRLVTRDTDALPMLDFLGTGMRIIDESLGKNAVEPGYRFVVRQQEEAAKRNDLKLFTRYSRLRRYFEARLPVWELGPSSPEVT